MSEEEQKPLEERIRDALEGLQHSHIIVTQTTRGVTFEVKCRDLDPFKAADDAIRIYEKLRKYMNEHGAVVGKVKE